MIAWEDVPKLLVFLSWIVLSIAAGCVEDDLVDCADGSACPSGTVCHVRGCLAPSQVAACATAGENTACSTEGIADGICSAGACVAAGCGNGLREATEQCDDGNRTDRDGCAANCLSDETCGNGFLDTLMGEACDDGNDVPGDGCQADCVLPRCGDGIVDIDSFEQCDAGAGADGNSDTITDRCRTNCRFPSCGDGVTDAGEGCDDGNFENADLCRNDCIEPACGNGSVDPGEQCDDGDMDQTDSCHTNCLVPRCGDGILDLQFNEQCDAGPANSNAGGAACRTNCRLPFCGDSIRDPGEVCDDGNFNVGDGCSANCQSDETCGNRIHDIAVGEECDDGPNLSHDGCSSQCQNELPRWDDVTPAQLTARSRHGAVYDASRKRVVVFGGAPPPPLVGAATLLGDTWESDGRAWIQRHPTIAPSARMDHAMVYDARRGLVYLFGGLTASGQRLNDLWVWNGINWAQVAVVGPRPSIRSEAAMAYDAASERIVVFGGKTATGYLGDTWMFQDGGWTLLTPPGELPPARSNAAIAYLPLLGEVILFGGEAPGGVLGDAWRFRDEWKSMDAGPEARRGARFTYDPATAALYLVGGDDGKVDPKAYGETWTWTEEGATWELIDDAPPISHHALVSMFDANLIVLVGGTLDATIVADVHLKTSPGWTLAPAAPDPSSRVGAGVAYDPVRGVTVMYGGLVGAVVVPETWEWNGLAWRLRPSPLSPDGGAFATMGYEPEFGVVLTGGSISSTCDTAALVDATWGWDGIAWTEIEAGSVKAHCSAAVAHDTRAARTVLLGGFDGGGSLSEGFGWKLDIWERDTGLDAPRKISGRSLAYDHARGVFVQFGNALETPPEELDLRWYHWDGAWNSMESENAPPPRRQNTLVYDPNRAGVTVFGGDGLAGALDDIWFLKEDRWFQVPTSMPLTYVEDSPAIVYHAASASFVAVSAPESSTATTYTMRYESRTADEACLEGIDRDGDGKPGLDDPDCWMYANASCPPCPDGASCSCAAAPTCGDGACSPLEDGRSCPNDCTAIAPMCGDHHCDPGESCPGDCS